MFFNVRELLRDHYHSFVESYNIQTRSTTKKAGLSLPEILGPYKQMVSTVKPEHQQKDMQINFTL